jgi:hydroxyethylthiazole kinase
MTNDIASKIWADIEAIRQTAPLIHNITNFVVMNNTANALLALGASPIMAHAIEEVEEVVAIASALVINIGTLSANWVEATEKAMLRAKALKKPIVFDPVGVGATSYRTLTARHLLASNTPTVIRGNASEISAILSENIQTKGVDSTHKSEVAIEVAKELANTYGCTIVISGATDFVINNNKTLKIENGHPMMARVTGMGCTATALIGAFLAVNPDALSAATRAMAVMGIAGEIAAETANGPGSMQIQFLDVLYNLRREDFERLVVSEWA